MYDLDRICRKFKHTDMEGYFKQFSQKYFESFYSIKDYKKISGAKEQEFTDFLNSINRISEKIKSLEIEKYNSLRALQADKQWRKELQDKLDAERMQEKKAVMQEKPAVMQQKPDRPIVSAVLYPEGDKSKASVAVSNIVSGAPYQEEEKKDSEIDLYKTQQIQARGVYKRNEKKKPTSCNLGKLFACGKGKGRGKE